MRILFRTKRLERCYEDFDLGTRAWGPLVARRYIERLDLVLAVDDFETLRHQRPLRCHELKGKQKGSWAMDLRDRYRLIFSIERGDLEILRIEEVSNHYGD